MKLLLVLLACLAAANAASMYGYSYYYQRGFCVYPSSQTYYYRISFNPYWCSTRYYAPILKVYPGSDCGSADWKETPIADVVSEMQNLLKETLHKIAKQMVTSRDAWIKHIDYTHASFKATFVSYMTRFYDYKLSCVTDDAEKAKLIKERDTKIAEYKAKLDKSRDEVLKKYNDALLSKLKSVIEYHAKLVENAAKCLTTRAEKIDAFTLEVNTKLKENVINYYKYLLAVLKKRTTTYREALATVHCSADWEKDIVDSAIASFVKHEMLKIRDWVADYSKRLLDSKDKLVTYYTCAYRCYLSNSYLQFSKRYYYSSCQRLGDWYSYTKYRYTTYCVPAYSYKWRKTTYTGLKTCDLNTLNKSVAEVSEELKKKLNEAYNKYVNEFAAWKVKWIQYHIEYVRRYKEIVKARHTWIIQYTTSKYQAYNGSKDLTAEQQAAIAQLTQKLNEKYNEVVAAYEKKLLAIVNDCMVTFQASIARYRKYAESYFNSFLTSYSSCMSRRDAKILSYKKSLECNRDQQRSSILRYIAAGKLAHFKNYIKMIASFHGDNLPEEATDLIEAYANKLITYCNSVMGDFDSYWADIIGKLVLHYSCSYKCTYRQLCAPTYKFGSYYRWTVCYPTAQSYSYYYGTYYYNCN